MSHKIFYIMFCIFGVVLFFSCTSTPIPQDDPNFLGDFDPVQIGNVMASTVSFGSQKSKEIEVFFAPRTNTIHLQLRDTINKINLSITKDLRTQFFEATTSFAASLNEDTLVNRKPTKKNAYSNSKCTIEWGITGSGHLTNDAQISFNYKYLDDNRPYFMIDLKSGPDTIMEGAMSPQTDIYFSPSQLEDLYTMLSQENLQAIVDELKERTAY